MGGRSEFVSNAKLNCFTDRRALFFGVRKDSSRLGSQLDRKLLHPRVLAWAIRRKRLHYAQRSIDGPLGCG